MKDLNQQDTNPFQPSPMAMSGATVGNHQDGEIRSPGILAHLIIAVLGFIASAIAFFCTCYAVAAIGVAVKGWLGFVAVSVFAGIAVGCIVVVKSTSAMSRWYSNALNKNA